MMIEGYEQASPGEDDGAVEIASLTVEGPVARLTLNRPDARNALSLPLINAMSSACDAIGMFPGVAVLVITGAGKSFCAGMDLRAVLDDPEAPGQLLSALGELTLKLRALPVVTLARVNGAAIGGGCGLACVCDVAITHADAKVGFPEVDLGVCPAVVAPWLVRKVGAGRARSVLLSGGLLTGQRGYELGMFDHVVPTLADLDEATEKLVERLAAGAPHALAATKGLLAELDGSTDAEIIRSGATLSAQVVAMPETQAMLRKTMK